MSINETSFAGVRLAREGDEDAFGTLTVHRLLPKIRLYQRHAPQIGVAFGHGFGLPDTFCQRELPAPPARSRGSVPITTTGARQ